MNNKKRLSNDYKMNKKFHDLHPETQYLLNIIMTLLDAAHYMDIEENLSGRDLLDVYSPDNQILKTEGFISWGSALHALLTDVIEEKDLLSVVSHERYLH